MLIRAETTTPALQAETGFARQRLLEAAAISAAREAWWTGRGRRALNVTLALLGLVILFPVMFLIGLLIKLSSAGPVLYAQARVGVDRRNGRLSPASRRRVVDHGGKLFLIYKFRTMYLDSDHGGERWATPKDPRVTPVGRFLRRYRLDELPQLWNVLMGDMNLVGPRPEQPLIFAQLRGRIPDYEKRQRVLPGITGLAQIHQPYDRSVEDVRRKIQFDLEYIQRESPLQDLKILLATLPAVVVKRGGW